MSDERPVAATQRHEEKLREQGHVARSGVVTTAAVAAAAGLMLTTTGAAIIVRLSAFTTTVVEAAFTRGSPADPGLTEPLNLAFDLMLELSAPVIAAALGAALLASFVQVGPLFSVKAVLPDARRLWRSSESPTAALAAALELARTVVIFGVLVVIFASMLRDIVLLPRHTLPAAVHSCAELWLTYAPVPVAALVVFAAIDGALAKARHTRASQMTRRERDDEDLETRANPAIRARRAEVQRTSDP